MICPLRVTRATLGMKPDPVWSRGPQRPEQGWARFAAALYSSPRAALRPFAQVVALTMLTHCSAVPLQNMAEPAYPPQYGTLVSDALKKFKDYSSYSNFEISSPRWVHAPGGWSWLVCMRYNDGHRSRFYSFFVDNNALVNQRYDIVTDQCGAQQYVPFDPTTGTVGRPAPFTQQPIY
jgi:hypothetical protein